MSFLGRVLDEFVVVGVGGIRDMMVRVLVEWRFVDGGFDGWRRGRGELWVVGNVGESGSGRCGFWPS
ncbi:hypothetical protein V6N12_033083 [Hibiscus sabdariffa]|uniref:Uncharacterized protein n=1 Tax=Hibiscus sabdariffa TaxID=183260 RepID=A0ABR2BCP4_9ROSI